MAADSEEEKHDRRNPLLRLGYLQSTRIYVLSHRILLYPYSSLELASYVSTGFKLDVIVYTLLVNSTTKGHYLSVLVLLYEGSGYNYLHVMQQRKEDIIH
jgi:hypothetical protein